MEKRVVFSINDAGQLSVLMEKYGIAPPIPHTVDYTKINFRQIIDLYIKGKIIQFSQENIEECLYNFQSQ